MTVAALASPAAPKKRGPNTPEGKARSRMNALKHGLRARAFGILPEEDQAEWAEHVHDLRAGYGPVDAAEEKLVTAIAVAMWKEIRADRVEADVMAEIPPCRPGRSHGTDMQEPRHALSLGTAIRYATAAGMATQRAQRAFLEHRKAKRAGLILPATESEHCTNDFARSPSRASAAAPEENKEHEGILARLPSEAATTRERRRPHPGEIHERFPAQRSARGPACPDRRPPRSSRPVPTRCAGIPLRCRGHNSIDLPRQFGLTLKHTSAMPLFAET